MACGSILKIDDLSCFRTKPCRRVLASDGCAFGIDRCQYSHNQAWPRRCPFYLSDLTSLRYTPLLCPDMEEKSFLCPRAATCPYSHTEEEVAYHPIEYKTKMCSKFKCGECRAYYCPDAHTHAELREVPQYNLPYTRGVNLPAIKNIKFTNKTNRPVKAKQCDRRYKSPCNTIEESKMSPLQPVQHVGGVASYPVEYPTRTNTQMYCSPFMMPSSHDMGLFYSSISPSSSSFGPLTPQMAGMGSNPMYSGPEKAMFNSPNFSNMQVTPAFPSEHGMMLSNETIMEASCSPLPPGMSFIHETSRFPITRGTGLCVGNPSNCTTEEPLLQKAMKMLELSSKTLNELKRVAPSTVEGQDIGDRAQVKRMLVDSCNLQREVLHLLE